MKEVAGKEVAALQARSEGFNMERKAEIGEMWLLVRGRGRGGRYFCGSRKFGIVLPKNWRTKCHQIRALIQNCVRYVNITNDSDSLTRV